MENPNKIEIKGLKTIHKLCNFGAEHDMEGCSFTEIVERMFSKIEKMKAQVDTLDEMLLNQGKALAKAQAVPEGLVLVPVETLNEALSWANCASSESWSDAQREEIDKHYEVIENAMIESQEQSND